MESKSNFCWFNPNLTFSPLSSRSSPSLLGLAASSSPKKDCPPSPSQGVAMDRTEALGRRFAQAGWLAVQAIANGVVLPLPLPATFFRFLLDPKKYRITEAEIQDLDPNTVRNINRVRSMGPLHCQPPPPHGPRSTAWRSFRGSSVPFLYPPPRPPPAH